MLGHSIDDLLGLDVRALVHPDDLSGPSAAVAHPLEAGSVGTFEGRYRCKDGSYRWLQWSASYDGLPGLPHRTARPRRSTAVSWPAAGGV